MPFFKKVFFKVYLRINFKFCITYDYVSLEKLTSFESWFNLSSFFFAGGLNLQTVVPISQASLPAPPSIASLQHPIPKRLLTGQLIQEIAHRSDHS